MLQLHRGSPAQLWGAQPLARCVPELWEPSQVPCALASVLQPELAALNPTKTKPSCTGMCFEPQLGLCCFQRG